MKVTAEMLRKAKVCSEQWEIFAKAWPKGMVLSRENLERCIKLGLWIELGPGYCFPRKLWREFRKATEQRRHDWEDRRLELLRADISAESCDLRQKRAEYKFLRSIIPDILAAARAMDEAEKGRKKWPYTPETSNWTSTANCTFGTSRPTSWSPTGWRLN